MYNNPNMYHYPYYVNSPMYPPVNMPRNNQQVVETILVGIQKEASAVDFYGRLATVAPNQKHREVIIEALEDEKVHLKQFTDLYHSLTGRQPIYEIDKVTFNSYEEGLQKAYQSELEDFELYRNGCLLTQYSPFRDVFYKAYADEGEHAKRLSSLASNMESTDYGKQPFIVNIEEATKRNNTFRTAIWTGTNYQVTIMSIDVGDDIGLEVHPNVDQFLRIEQGQGLVQMGDSKDQLDFEKNVSEDYAIMVPAGKWHNLTNTGQQPLKLYTIYAPPEHPFGTVHETKADAMAADEHHDE